MSEPQEQAPGWPGLPPNWAPSNKNGVGTALNRFTRVWFTVTAGVVTEVFYPRADLACMRDMGLIVTGGKDFFSDEKTDAGHKIQWHGEYIPAIRLENTCKAGRYRIEKEILADPRLNALLQQTTFKPLQGGLKDYHLYVLLAPHLENRGSDNTAWVGNYKGVPMLFAERDGRALALACSAPWLGRSVGFAGVSDGWQDLRQHGRMTWQYPHADKGNVALCGEIDLAACGGMFRLALGLGSNPFEAGNYALASLYDNFEQTRAQYVEEWQRWHASHHLPDQFKDDTGRLGRKSLSAMRAHEAKGFPGCYIASLAIPWGEARGDNDLGGYHLVWIRDLVETAGAFLAVGAHLDILALLDYLQVVQEADGHWAQNMWLDSRPYWNGIQLDETAFPILLIALARREGALPEDRVNRFWPMVRKAAGYLVRNGPVTPQDRWEEESGLSPFTLAVEITALLIAAGLAGEYGEPDVAHFLRETADNWNARIETWTYVMDTELAKKHGVEGYYVRIAPPDKSEESKVKGLMPVKHRPVEDPKSKAVQTISPDALALVRFGLRAADDPRIRNTVKVIDALLKVDFPWGPGWHRYNGDFYGEHEDGSPFDGSGIGRVWPLLTGERAHYEIAAGNMDEARRLCRAMAGFAGEGGLLPEQSWDTRDIPERGLFFGRPTGSAMPLVWAHAEYVKLLRSLHDGKIFDMPRHARERYLGKNVESPFFLWRFNHKSRQMPAGRTLRIEVLAPAEITWTHDGWRSTLGLKTRDSGLGVFIADLPTDKLAAGTTIVFTFFWPQAACWEGTNFEIRIVEIPASGA